MSTRKKIGILWDLDGTLSDSFRLGFSSTNKILEEHGKTQISEADYHVGTQYPTHKRLAWHASGDPNHPIGLLLAQNFNDHYEALVSAKTAPLHKGIKEALVFFDAKFPDIKMGVLSNASNNYVNAVLAVNDISQFFQIALGADKVSAAKPAPDGLINCCHRLGLLVNNCVYVGDSPTDGAAAAAAGMTSIGVSWGSHAVETISPSFSYIVHTADELKVSINKLFNIL